MKVQIIFILESNNEIKLEMLVYVKYRGKTALKILIQKEKVSCMKLPMKIERNDNWKSRI